MPTRLTQTGAEVQDDLYKIEDIDLATEEKAGLMSPEDKTKLDNIDAEIPTKLSDLEEDPTHRTVTEAEKTTWNNKSDFDGRYDSLIGRPYIPQRTSDLRNDSGFITNVVNDLVNYYLKNEIYTKAEVDQIVSAVGGFTVRVVDVLPTASEETMRALYLVPSADPEAGNVKDEWITIENAGTYSWERIGSTAIDLDGYVTDDELTAALQGYVTSTTFTTALAGKQDVIQDLDDIRAGATAGASAYQKPSGGIPSSDMSEAVRTSLGKADTALQSFTETDPTVPAWAKAQNPPTEVFWATYGTTTAAEVDAAVSAGKVVMCERDDGTVYLLSYPQTNYGSYYFVAFVNEVEFILVINKSNNAWSAYTRNFALATDRVNDITGNETATNKYPSTKAVADYVASKAEVFWAEYGVTTASEVDAAVAAGKIVMCEYSQSNSVRCYVYSGNIYGSASYNFRYLVSVVNDQAWYIRVRDDNNQWSNGVCILQNSNMRLSSFQSTPDDTHYPSEKLVKDSLDAIHQIPSGGTSGQVLSKASGTDYDTEWVTPSGGSSDAVLYTEQTLTDAQKAQARANIQTLHANFGETITPVTTGAETTQNKAQTLVGNEDDTTKYPCTKAVADALGKWGVVSQTQTWRGSQTEPLTYTMSNQVYGLIPQANIDLFVSVGAVFNENSGYFEMNGLTDISYQEMARIINITSFVSSAARDKQYILSGDFNTRTAVAIGVPGASFSSVSSNISGMCFGNTFLETVKMRFSPIILHSSISDVFYSCRRLREIQGVLNAKEVTTFTRPFAGCYSLENVSISNLKTSISMSECPILSIDSILYMINNSGTANFTITLHVDAYARATADADVQTALSNHTNVTLASA